MDQDRELPEQPARTTPPSCDAADDRIEDLSAAALEHSQLRDADVEEAERELVDADFAEEKSRVRAERERVERARRLLEDQNWVEDVRAVGFAGPDFNVMWEELAWYAVVVLMGWMRTKKIFRQAAAVGRPVKYQGVLDRRDWTRDERLELACESVARGMKYFRDKVLIPGKWDPRRGASLKTYLVGAVVLQFANVFNTWTTSLINGDRGWLTIHDSTTSMEDEVVRSDRRQSGWSDPPCETVSDQLAVQGRIGQIEDDTTRALVELVYRDDLTREEAGRRFDLNAEAVGARFRRLRRKWLP